MNERNNPEGHIKDIKGKSKATFQITQIIAGNDNFNWIEMEAYWELLSSCVFPITLYKGATISLNKEKYQRDQWGLDGLLKRIPMILSSTPREALYMVSELLDVETMTNSNRMELQTRLERNPNQLSQLVKTCMIQKG